MKKLVNISVICALLLALVPMVGGAHTVDFPDTTPLIAGGGNPDSAMNVGEVQLWNDADNLYVTYVTTGGWCIIETHLHVAGDVANIPQKNGNPIPGKFDYKSAYDLEPCVDETAPYVVPLASGWKLDGEILTIGAHAVVVNTSSMITETVVSEAGVEVFGPKADYFGLNDTNWGTAGSGVATWVHGSWPTITGATWISTAYHVEDVVNDSWRWFHDVMTLPEKGFYISGKVIVATSDNAEEAYFNGALIGSSGEVQGDYYDDGEWGDVSNYPISPLPGENTLDFITRNYACYFPTREGSYYCGEPPNPESNPAGLIYMAEATYYPEETAWGEGSEFPGKNWATYFEYDVQYAPDLSLAKEISADGLIWEESINVVEGDDIYYMFTVTNIGNVGLTDISVSDPDLDLSSCTWSDLLNNGDTTSCELGPFEAELGTLVNEGTASAKFGTEDVGPAIDTASYTAEAPPCTSPPSGLVSWWPGDGDATDIFGSNDGTLMNGASFDTGKVEQAFSFDEDQDAVRFGDVLDDVLAGPDKQFTIDLWLKINAMPDGNPGETVRADLVSKLGDSVVGSVHERQLSLILRPDGWLDLAFYGALDGSSLRLVRTEETLETDVWYHIAVVYDGSVDSNDGLDRVTMYRNGTLLTTSLAYSSGSLGDIPDGPANLAIGGSVASNLDVGYSLDGNIDEVEIFNRVLSETEIGSIYEARSGGKCKPVFVESVAVPSTGEEVCSLSTLESGKQYLFESSGTFAYRTDGISIADAEWSLRPVGDPYNPGGEPIWIKGDDVFTIPSGLDISLDGTSAVNIDWGDFNPAHMYTHIRSGENANVCFIILDSNYIDNSGSLQLDIYEIP
jgi:hypothetical protein